MKRKLNLICFNQPKRHGKIPASEAAILWMAHEKEFYWHANLISLLCPHASLQDLDNNIKLGVGPGPLCSNMALPLLKAKKWWPSQVQRKWRKVRLCFLPFLVPFIYFRGYLRASDPLTVTFFQCLSKIWQRRCQNIAILLLCWLKLGKCSFHFHYMFFFSFQFLCNFRRVTGWM